MLRKQVMTEWNTCKEKINNLKLTEKDKEIISYLEKSELKDYINVYGDGESFLLNLGEAIAQISNKLDDFDTDNNLLLNWVMSLNGYGSLTLDWIGKKWTIKSQQERIRKLEVNDDGPHIEEVD